MPQYLIDFLNRSTWKYAKSMPKWPHWYVNRKKLVDKEDHAHWYEVVKHIREHGYEEKFYSKSLTYFNVGDWKLWTMGGELIEDAKEYLLNCHRDGEVDNILNIAHINGLPPSVVDPNNGIDPKGKLGKSKGWWE